MYYRLADRTKIAEVNGKAFLVDDSLQELEGCTGKGLEALRRLATGCTRLDLEQSLGPEETDDLLRALDEAGLLRTTPLTVPVQEIFAKQLYYLDDLVNDPDAAQSRLTTAIVAIVGVGGVGTVVLQHLIGAGVRSFVLLEPDRVSLDNLNRQYIYNRTQLGIAKVEAAAEYARRMDERIVVHPHKVFVDSPEAMQVLTSYKVDMIVDAADTPAHLESILGDYSVRHGIPPITCAVGRQLGTWGPLVVPGITQCLPCIRQAEELEMDPTEKAVRSQLPERTEASFGPTNSLIATLLAKDVLHYLATRNNVPSLGRRCTLDFQSLEVHWPEAATAPCACWKGEA